MRATGTFNSEIGPFQDPGTGTNVTGTAQVTWEVEGADPFDAEALRPQIDGALLYGLTTVISQKLAANQVALPTLQPSLPYYQAEIEQTSCIANLGLRLVSFQPVVNIQAPAPAFTPYTGPMPPSPMEATAAAFKKKAEERLDPRNYEVKATVNVGGLKIKASTDQGLDTEGIKNQIVDKATSNIIWWVGGCLVVGVVLLFLLGLGGYIAYLVMAA